jgi:hypothetical protein
MTDRETLAYERKRAVRLVALIDLALNENESEEARRIADEQITSEIDILAVGRLPRPA